MLEQLELFQVLNQEQQTEVNDYVVRENQRVVNRVASIKRIIDLLETGGFVADIDFERDFQIGESIHERTFGWGADKFKAEITVNTTAGGIRLIHKRFYNGKVETTTSSVGREGDKLEFSMISSHYRSYIPASLLVKLHEYNENQELKFSSYHKKKDMLSYTINKYTILFPNAKVQEGMGYQGRSSFATVLISFPSDSYVEFKLGFEQDKEFVFRKWDAKVNTLKGMDLLKHFNKQS